MLGPYIATANKIRMLDKALRNTKENQEINQHPRKTNPVEMIPYLCNRFPCNRNKYFPKICYTCVEPVYLTK